MKKFLIISLMALSFIGVGFSHTSVFADATDEVCAGIGLASSNGSCPEPTGSKSVTGLIGSVISILSYIIGIAAVIMILVAGFKYITAGGDSNAVGSAKSTLTYAIVGLIIAALAQILVRFVLTRTGDTPTTNIQTTTQGPR